MTIEIQTNYDSLQCNNGQNGSHEYIPDMSQCCSCLGSLEKTAWQARCGDFFCANCLGTWGKCHIQTCNRCKQKNLTCRLINIKNISSKQWRCLCFECFYDVYEFHRPKLDLLMRNKRQYII